MKIIKKGTTVNPECIKKVMLSVLDDYMIDYFSCTSYDDKLQDIKVYERFKQDKDEEQIVDVYFHSLDDIYDLNKEEISTLYLKAVLDDLDCELNEQEYNLFEKVFFDISKDYTFNFYSCDYQSEYECSKDAETLLENLYLKGFKFETYDRNTLKLKLTKFIICLHSLLQDKCETNYCDEVIVKQEALYI